MSLTIEQQKMIEHYWSELAEEPMRVRPDDAGNATVYAYGSELAARRLADRMNAGEVGYSASLESWYYVNRDGDDSVFRKQRIMKALQYHADNAEDRYRPIDGIMAEEYYRQLDQMNTLAPVVRNIFHEAMNTVENNW